jgi:predicted deacetylase
VSARVRAVALHDVEPATFSRCVEIRDWLFERGVRRVTLLVIPAADLHSFARRSPELRDWVARWVDAGDCVAQHGMRHLRTRRAGLARSALAWLQGGPAAEFVGLDDAATRKRVEAGHAILAEAGFAPRGFVAPAYAYTPPLRRELEERFDWYADLGRVFVRGAPPRVAPAFCLGTSGVIRRPLSPLAARASALASRDLMRIDIHPADFDHPGHVRALGAVIQRTRDLDTVVYDELVASRPG